MKRIRLIAVLITVTVVMSLGLSAEALAKIYDLGNGQSMSLEGYFRQEFSFNVSGTSEEKTNQSGLQSAYQIWYLDTNFEFSRSFELRTILRMWGDMAYAILGDNSHFEKYFKKSKHNLQWDDDFDQILRECYITYYSSKFLFRAGRQQIGWGEADGLRLMDVVNPLDYRRDFAFYDTEGYEEVRVPKWMIKTEFYPGNIGGLYDVGVELLWNPGDIQETQTLLPRFLDAHLAGGTVPGMWPVTIQQSWGTWGVPMPFAPLPVRLNVKERANTMSNSEFGARIKFSFSDTFMTLNYWHGWDPGGILKYNGVMADPEGVVIPGPPFPVALNFDVKYERIDVLGFTISRELFGVGNMTCQNANPVLRVEALYSMNQKFNTKESAFGPGGAPTMLFKIVDKDQIRYMIGFDWAMNIPLLNPRKSTFVSGQFFHIHTPDITTGNKAMLQLAPYNWRYPRNQFYYTLLVRTEYKNEQVVPSVLYVQDCHTKAAWVKSKVYFRIGDHWRPEIGYLWIGNNQNIHSNHGAPGKNWQSFGLFEDRDQVYVRIQYQF